MTVEVNIAKPFFSSQLLVSYMWQTLSDESIITLSTLLLCGNNVTWLPLTPTKKPFYWLVIDYIYKVKMGYRENS